MLFKLNLDVIFVLLIFVKRVFIIVNYIDVVVCCYITNLEIPFLTLTDIN